MKQKLITALWVLLAVAWLLPTVTAQECAAVKLASAEQAANYLQHAGSNAEAAECVQVAFRQIANSPVEEAIPVLIRYLSYKRPLNEGERNGIFMHGKGLDVLYPAVHELYTLGAPAESALVHFIAEDKNATGAARENALYSMLLIHHGNALAVIQRLHSDSAASASAEAIDRLQAAAKAALRWCDERWQTRCEDALNW